MREDPKEDARRAEEKPKEEVHFCRISVKKQNTPRARASAHHRQHGPHQGNVREKTVVQTDATSKIRMRGLYAPRGGYPWSL